MPLNPPSSHTGTTGAAGATGAIGPTGAQGPTGAAGATGAVGSSRLDFARITASVTATGAGVTAAAVVVTGNSVAYNGTIRGVFWSPLLNIPTGCDVQVAVMRDSTEVGEAAFAAGPTTFLQTAGSVMWFDTPATGAHTYSIRAFLGAGSGGMVVAGAGGTGVYLPAFMEITSV